MKYVLFLSFGAIAALLAYLEFENIPKELETAPHIATVDWDSGVVIESAADYSGILNGHVRINNPSVVDGKAFNFDFEYPADFEVARWLPEIEGAEGEAFVAPSTAPMIWGSCFYSSPTRSLNTDESLELVFVDMSICRAVSTDDPTKTALVGMLLSVEVGPEDQRSKMPIDLKTEKCAAEATVWFEHVGEPEDQFAVCVIIDSVDDNLVELIVLERIGGQLVVLAGIDADIGKVFRLRTGRSRESHTMARYDLIKSWTNSPELFDAAIPEIWREIRTIFENGDIEYFTSRNAIKISSVDLVDGGFQYTYTSNGTILVEQWLSNLPDRGRMDHQLRHGVNVLNCRGGLTAAALDMQYLRYLFTYRIIDYRGNELASGPVPSRCLYFG